MLQWHHMLSSTDSDNVGIGYYSPYTVPGLEMNTLWDGRSSAAARRRASGTGTGRRRPNPMSALLSHSGHEHGALPAARARVLAGVLRSRPVHALTRPWAALALSAGGLPVLYFTPLYDATAVHPVLHALLHLHFLAAGCLFAWVIAGPDPAPDRPTVPARLVVLGVAIAVHAVVSQLLYAGFLIGVHAPVDQVRGGAELMYYGGDIAELLLAAALVSTWRPASRSTRTGRAGPESVRAE
ncbi:cytochrome c oxidase assembly protein [Actinocorallia sp. B10E7]|uniref:cytochrome c oxidase assembly protein n=1 Tax=Actinocorallia sp. B10E7 TaxID=3153558 RepID=UPI00325E2811